MEKVKNKKIVFVVLSGIIIMLLVLLSSFVIGKDVTKVFADSSGIEFISNCPTTTTTYSRGNGTVTFVPATQTTNASIILDNAVLYADTKTSYWSIEYEYVGIAYKGDVDIVLRGENKIYLNNTLSSSGIFVYDGNATISGDGSLFVGYNDGEVTSNTIYPIRIMGNYDVLNGKKDGNFADTGNLTINSGTLTLDSKDKLTSACLFAHNNIVINGGVIKTNGNSIGISSNYAGVIINGGSVTCENFVHDGMLARGGDITIGGDDTKVRLQCKQDARYSVGIRAGDDPNTGFEVGNIYINGGDIDVEAGNFGICAYEKDSNSVGDIIISGGDIQVDVMLYSSSITGMYNSGKIEILGGRTLINTYGNTAQSICMWPGDKVVINGGRLEAHATSEQEDKYVVAIYAPNGVEMLKGQMIVSGKKQAIASNVTLAEDIEAYGAVDITGEGKEIYNADNIDSYKYMLLHSKSLVESVAIVDKDIVLDKNGSHTFNVEITGIGEVDGIVWTISGANSKDTTIDANGTLTIGKNETAKEIVVTATSSRNSEQFSSITVKINSDNAFGWYWYLIIGVALFGVIGAIIYVSVRKKHRI